MRLGTTWVRAASARASARRRRARSEGSSARKMSQQSRRPIRRIKLKGVGEVVGKGVGVVVGKGVVSTEDESAEPSAQSDE